MTVAKALRFAAIGCACLYGLGSFCAEPLTPVAVFDKTFDLVHQNFYDKTFRGLPWDDIVRRGRKEISTETGTDELASRINSVLSQLHASHTEFLSADDQEYYALQAVFHGKLNGSPYCGIGALFQKVESHWFIRDVFHGSPAEKAGLKTGDELVSANGAAFRPVRSFDCKTKKSVQLEVRRSAGAGPQSYSIRPELSAPEAALLRETIQSKRILAANSRRVGYFHLWSGTDDRFKEELDKAAAEFQGKTDALILDLRDGFGGAYPAYLDSFFSQDSEGHPIRAVYTKPIFLLINDGVRSGKEWLTYILKQKKRATLVGSRTKGYFLAGKLFEIVPEQFSLYLAIAEFKPGGMDLEGNGVQPDVSVPFDFRYSEGKDPQLEEAIRLASKNPISLR